MTEQAPLVDLNLPERLLDPGFRQRFFAAEASASIAEQIVALRKRRGLNQTELADKAGTKQPAISRVESADYQNWSFKNLRGIAGALDARVRVVIEASEDVLSEYEDKKQEEQPAEGSNRNVGAIDVESIEAFLKAYADVKPDTQAILSDQLNIGEIVTALNRPATELARPNSTSTTLSHCQSLSGSMGIDFVISRVGVGNFPLAFQREGGGETLRQQLAIANHTINVLTQENARLRAALGFRVSQIPFTYLEMSSPQRIDVGFIPLPNQQNVWERA